MPTVWTVVRDDALAFAADASADLIVLNPPFHIGSAVHTGIAHRMFADAARVLRPGRRTLDGVELAPRLPLRARAHCRPDPADRPQREVHRHRVTPPDRAALTAPD